MKRVLVICFILIMCFSFVLANGTTNNATDKTATIPVNVTVLPHSTVYLTGDATMFNFTLDPTMYEDSDHGSDWKGGFKSNKVSFIISSNHHIYANFVFEQNFNDWEEEVIEYFEIKLLDSKGGSWAWRRDEPHDNNRYPLNHGIGQKSYTLEMFIQNIKKDWWEIEAGNSRLGTIIITLSADDSPAYISD